MSDRLRWLTILVPVAGIGLIEVLSDSLLDADLPFPWDTILVMTIVVIFASAISRLAWGRIDRLTRDVEARSQELERRSSTVRALHRVSVAIAAITDLDAVLRAVVDQARELLRADAAVLLLEDSEGRANATATSGDPEIGRALAARSATAGSSGGARSPVGDVAGSRLEAPLQRGGETIGRLVVGSLGSRSYDADEVETLASLANQAAIAVENARLQDRLRDLAVTEERERIAREMHDGLAQVLGYVNTKSQAVEQLLEDGRVVEARSHLRQLASAARSLYVDVREAILGLRSAIDPASGLVPAMEAYAARFSAASNLVVEVRATSTARGVHLPDPVEGHLFRIVQEALTNVRKHAGAHRATVRLAVRTGRLILEVEDDGHGMPATVPGPTDWPHYGLGAMRERAAAVGGSIEWRSGSDGGTVVALELPLAPSAPTTAQPGPARARPEAAGARPDAAGARPEATA